MKRYELKEHVTHYLTTNLRGRRGVGQNDLKVK